MLYTESRMIPIYIYMVERKVIIIYSYVLINRLVSYSVMNISYLLHCVSHTYIFFLFGISCFSISINYNQFCLLQLDAKQKKSRKSGESRVQ